MKKFGILCAVAFGVLLLGVWGTQAKAAETAAQQVTAVELPQNLNFYLDPAEEYGYGQIYSDRYIIRNAGNEPMTFSIEIALSVLEPEAVVAFLPEAWEEEPTDRSIYMYAVLEGNQGERRYSLTDAENPCKESVVLQPAGSEGDSFSIRFGGSLSRSEEWKSGELAVHAIYAMSAGVAEYPVELSGEHIRIEEIKTIGEKKVELCLVPEEGYSLPAKIRVYQNDLEREASYDAGSGKVLLEQIDGSVVIYADGITKAKLPDAEALDAETGIWTWTAQEGVQAYEYTFRRGDEEVKKGRAAVEQGAVHWNWSEGLEDGDYQLTLKAIGDAVHCLNSGEAVYSITVDREAIQVWERAQEQQTSAPPDQESEAAPSTEREDALTPSEEEETASSSEEEKMSSSSNETKEEAQEEPSSEGEETPSS
ncbi:MAG: hypothetical protein NC399_02035 [Muribaculum sp.]|nr:hypothetical protein [Muribaculum sp.]